MEGDGGMGFFKPSFKRHVYFCAFKPESSRLMACCWAPVIGVRRYTKIFGNARERITLWPHAAKRDSSQTENRASINAKRDVLPLLEFYFSEAS
jgi:hypothetical protein